MKRFTPFILMMAMLVELLPAHAAGEQGRLDAVQTQCLELGLKIWWFIDGPLIRRYGTDRMLRVYDGKSTLRTLENKLVSIDEFDAFGYFNSDGLAPACRDGRWGVVDLDGKAVVDFLYDTQAQAEAAGDLAPVIQESVDEDEFHEGLHRVQDQESGLWGFVNEAEELAIPCLFDAVGYFDRGYASVMVGGVFGLLETPLDNEVIASFREATGDKFDVTWVNTDNTLVPLSADQLIVERKLMGYSGPKVSIAQRYYDYGLLDLAGRRLVPTIYGHTEYGGLIGGERFGFFTGKRSQDGNSVVYTDLLGNEFTPFDLVEKPEFDTAIGFTIDPEVYSEHDDEFHEGLLKVRDKATGKWGAVDKTGKLVIPCQWAAMSRFGEGLACVRESEEGKEGYINAAGELVMPCILKGNNAGNPYYEPGILIAVEYLGLKGVWRNPTRKDKVDHWAKAEVDAATQAGYVTESCKAYQTYTITREQFASLAVNYLEKKTGQTITPAPADTFTDTVDEDVLKAYAAGIVQGMGDGLFGPGRPLSREQLATMLWRAMEKVGVTAPSADLSAYTDNDQVSDWARDSVAALAGLKVMEGNGGGLLSPKNSCTVEQAILLVYRAAK